MWAPRFVSPFLGILIAVAGLAVGASPAQAATPALVDDVGTVAAGDTITLDLTANDAGLDDEPIDFQLIDGSYEFGDPSLDPSTGELTYTAFNVGGEDQYTYQATDVDGETSEATVTITVTPPRAIVSAGPLTNVSVDEDLNCAVNHVADSSGEFFGDTACGTFLVVDGEMFSPAVIPAGTPGTPWTPVEQTALTGNGSAGDPFRYSTTVAAGTTGVTITQTDSYVVGQESYRTSIRVDNDGPARDVRLYRAADCYLADSDNGLGAVDTTTGAVSCTSPTSDRIEQFLPLSPGSRYYEAGYGEVWSAISAMEQFPNTCRCDEEIDNGAGLSWDISLTAGGSATRNSLITFSPVGAVPLTTEKTVDDSEVGPGDEVTYTITVRNPGDAAATLEDIRDDLPDGFAYVDGSTDGATTDDPTTTGDELVWSTPTTVPAGGDVSLTFSATAADTEGDYFNNATATATDLFVNPTGDTAQVTVEQVVAAVEPVTNLQAAGAGAGSVVLTWLNPDQLDGIVVRWSTDDFPQSPTDGTGVPVTGTPETVTIDGLDDGATVFFSVFATLGEGVSEPAFTELSPFACPDLTPALDATGGLITGQEWVACSSPTAHDPANSLDTVLPRTGATQALMTSGDREVATPPDDGSGEGPDNGTGSRGAFDVSIYRIDLQVPAGANCLQFDYVFASEEYPEYVGQSFNDGFLAQLDQNEWVVDENSSISATGNFAKMADGDFISVNSAVFADPAKVFLPAVNGTGYDGMSVPLTASTPITPGAHAIYLSIFDAGDGVLDSAAFVDHLRTTDLNCQAGSNQPPVAIDDTANTVGTAPVTVNVLANDTDGEGQALTVSDHTAPAHGTVTCTATDCTYTAEAGFTGTDTFTYTVNDGHGGVDTATVTVTVASGNAPPDAVADTATTHTTDPVTINVLANDTDPEGDDLVVTSATPTAAHGTVSCTATACTYTATGKFTGTDSFTYAISDGNGGTDSATVTVTVENRPPVAVDDTAETVGTTPVTVAVRANDSDPDGHALTVTDHTAAAHGTVSCTASSCTYTAESGFTGTDSFTYTVGDGHGGSDTATVTVTVEEPPAVSELGISISRTLVTWPGQVTVTGTAKNSAGDVVAGVELELWQTVGGVSTKVDTVTTGADGTASSTQRPEARTSYMWKTVSPALASAAKTVKVRPALTMRVSETKLAVHAPLVVEGDSSPSRVGTPVRLQRLKGHRWITVKSTTIDEATNTLEPTGHYRFRLSSTKSGAFKFRVMIPADAGREASTSVVRKVKFHKAKVTSVSRGRNQVVKIKNTGEVAINLRGWELVNKHGTTIELSSKKVTPGHTAKIKTHRSIFSRNDKVKLVDPNGFVVHTFRM
ncbi:tandem-95 repeat protein [Nocardioides sp. JQ2195]|uniref:Ig-like domain-containing protein n=1 Tax=Nocardioides sp. JQ2195 TaxID=2592334 RepID=UPI00143E6A2B|nr:Ig-like domain-containing protein [Nocardioides sp. JQ2195]QIX27821.1 tandem-95 repeat protein [Nocardioides sp. JQ2195]